MIVDFQRASDTQEAIRIQQELAPRVSTEDRPAEGDLRAAFDISCDFGSKEFFAACCLFEREEPWNPVRTFTGQMTESFPYIPGLLSFREIPSVINVWRELPDDIRSRVGLLMVDGHGIAHPRGIGIASHLGLALDRPSIGVAKNPFIGVKDGPWRLVNGRKISCEVVPKGCRRPLYVSAGHRHSPQGAVETIEPMLKAGFNPLKTAHNAANEARRAAKSAG
jgi:deoxyribonuclease V